MAGLTALTNTNVPHGLQRIYVDHDIKTGIYEFVFYCNGEWIYSIIDDKLYLRSPGWDSLSVQRELLQQIDRDDKEGVYRKTHQSGSKAIFFAQCRDRNETSVSLFKEAFAKAYGDYVLLRLVKPRNPWGKVRKGIWEGAWSDGSKEWTTEVQEEMDHKFGSDSRWIGVDVPWKAAYHEKFHIKSTHDPPLILVLSHFDGRYFKGLYGQYSFRLHFRLHCQDYPDGEDYIIRAHGNYLMERSVSVELPDFPAGNYVVYLKATGERGSRVQSVEQAVKREAANRTRNEKLAQVGYAYGLAHSKAEDRIDKVSKLQQKKHQRKLPPHITKNTDKRKRRRAEWRAKQNHFDEEFNADVKAEATEAKKRAQKADDEALSKRTKEIKISEEKDEPVVSMDSTAESTEEKQEVPPVSGGPPAPIEEEESLAIRPRPAYDSSHSPVEDWEALYSSDGMARKPRLTQADPSRGPRRLQLRGGTDQDDPMPPPCPQRSGKWR
ncbi:calpain [Fusarium mundagurra]|uniref:Calpain n=1 Tax=Fusarium mundagurra TaxID=1567541 RepID=A0A8H5Z514_9HYPO|nr:calpain [Fusarium mundagurra]